MAGGQVVFGGTSNAGGGGTPGGSDTQVQFNNAGSFAGDASLVWNSTSKELAIGTQLTRTTPFNGIPAFIVQEGAGLNPIEIHAAHAVGIDMYVHSPTPTRSPTISLLRSRGTQDVPVSINSGDAIGAIESVGYDGTQYLNAAFITWNATQNWAVGANGSNIGLFTVPNGSAVARLAVVIDQTTFVGIGANNVVNPPLFQLHTAPGNSVCLGSASSAPTDGNLGNGSIVFYLDEVGNNLKVRVKYSNGTLKTATIALV